MSRSINYRTIVAGIAIRLLPKSQGIHATEGNFVPIETLFGQQIVEENLNGGNIGGYETTGALDFCKDNPLRVGSLDGALIGTRTVNCTLLSGAEVFMCAGMIKISEEDSITFTGLSPNNDDDCKVAITGGTGYYEEAQGSITISSRDDESFSHVYEKGTMSNECTPIDQLVGDGLKEVNTLNYWSRNVLTNSMGDQVADTFGFCNSLPGSSLKFCTGAWVLYASADNMGRGDIITFSGHFPSTKIEDGVVAVTGGTGCYAGVSATLSLTLLSFDEDGNVFNYKIDSTTEGLPLKSKMKKLEEKELIW